MNTKLAPAGQRSRGFSLREVMCILVAIMVLGFVLLPRLFEAADPARLSHALLSYQAVRTAAAAHLARDGQIASSNGVPLRLSTLGHYDRILVAEGHLDRPWVLVVGDRNPATTVVRVAFAGDMPEGYDLNGDGIVDTTNGQYLVEAVISGVSQSEAMAINEALDGTFGGLGARFGGDDTRGRVRYHLPPPGGKTDVHIYVLHQ